jgi:hypothetical protein
MKPLRSIYVVVLLISIVLLSSVGLIAQTSETAQTPFETMLAMMPDNVIIVPHDAAGCVPVRPLHLRIQEDEHHQILLSATHFDKKLPTVYCQQT